jgi:hypothetical protein
MKKRFFLLLSFLAALGFVSCERVSPGEKSPVKTFQKPHPEKSSFPSPTTPQGVAHSISAPDLQANYHFNIPRAQEKGDALPPQPGQIVLGQTVRGSNQSDTNWTAFTLVLYKDAATGFKILTQKRAIEPKGVLETHGGHLAGGQSWREGAYAELMQEAGLKPELKDMMFLQGAEPRVSTGNGRLYGNANFFVVFSRKPDTTSTSYEIDADYGHRWLDLKETYHKILDEQTRLDKLNQGRKDGEFYSFFRGHLLTFCRQVVICADL